MTVEDHLAMLAIAPRYAAAIDARDLEAAVALFASDAALVLPRPPRDLAPVREHRGHDQIAAALGEVASVELTVHEIVGQFIDPLTSDRAHGHVRCVAHHVNGEQDAVWHLHYDDTYVRLSDGWRIARRALHVDFIEIRGVRPRVAAPIQENP